MKNNFMDLAIKQAKLAQDAGEVPVGAVIVENGKVISAAYNQNIALKDPTAHAEVLALRQAALVKESHRLDGCDLYVTLEPCPMCAAAISLARIRRVYYGAFDDKSGGVDNGARVFNQSSCHHKPDVYSGISEKECSLLLKEFFAKKR